MKKSTKLIYYHGGCYGTFFEWLYCHFVNPDHTVKNPFTSTGSSHNFLGNNWTVSNNLMHYINSENEVPIGRCNPAIFDAITQPTNTEVQSYEEITKKDLEFLRNHFTKILVIYPSDSAKFWIENNVIDKIILSEDEFYQGIVPLGVSQDKINNYVFKDSTVRFRNYLNKYVPSEDLNQWGKKSTIDFEIWELRELLSYFYFNTFEDKYTIWNKMQDQFPEIKFISLDELKLNFEKTIKDYLNFFDIANPEDKQINEIYNSWLPRQVHINKDKLLNDILDSLLNTKPIDWSSEKISIIDEAFIQKSLRDAGYEIKCFGLDKFPTNTNSFLKILEKQ